MDNPFDTQLNKGARTAFYYTLYDECSCEVMTCTEDEISIINEKYIFVRMDYSIPVFRTPQCPAESINPKRPPKGVNE